MIASSKPICQAKHAQHDDRFLKMVPAIQGYARSAFRNLQPETREDAICAVVADAFFAFRRLVELGKQDLAYATPLARFAVRRYWTGRCACMPRGRDIMPQRQEQPTRSLSSGWTFSRNKRGIGAKCWSKTVAPRRQTSRRHESTWQPGFGRSPDGTAELPRPWPPGTHPAR